MLDLKFTRVFNTESRPVLSGHVVVDEGAALVFVKDGALTKVRMATGAANEIFAGFSMSRNVPALFLPAVEEGVVDSSLTVVLPRLPIAGQIGVKVGGTFVTVVAGAPANASEVRVVADKVIFHEDHENDTFEILFQHEPLVSEANQLTGDAPIGGLSSTFMEQIGVITDGDVSTNFFDAGVDWSSAINPSLGADGVLTVGGSGTVLKNVTVLETPSTGNPMLTVRVKV